MFIPTPERRCTVCGKFLPATIEYFYLHKNYTFGIRSECRECVSQRQKKYHKENREKRHLYAKKQYAKLTKIEKQKHIQRIYKWRISNQEKFHTSNKKWKNNNREKVRATWRRHDALKNGYNFNYTANDLKRLYAQSGGWCTYCDGPANLNGKPYHIDHMIPLSKGGSDTLDNLVISCYKCNCSKGDKSLNEWEGPVQP